ncbi:hypothetical protein [Lysobacter sp. FW306-1B-D06B]|uniref:hypothetical protein n=1 Tax=Lysobacter sp. FW306-1B-D06B TaxID=3140250 RepID=UPI0031403D21
MKTMPCAMALLAIAVVLSVSACSNGAAMQQSVRLTTPGADDGVVCPSVEEKGAGPKAVYVDIQYAVDGTPSAVPNKCYVDNGTTVTWRDPADRTTQFNLVFSNAGLTGTRGGALQAAQAAERYKVAAVIQGRPGDNYKYGIQANGKVVDPAIIIKK